MTERLNNHNKGDAVKGGFIGRGASASGLAGKICLR